MTSWIKVALRYAALLGLGSLAALAVVVAPAPARGDWLQDLETDAVTWMNQEGVPGVAMAIVQNDVVIYAKGFGHVTADPTSPLVDANTLFEIGSLTKAFIATQTAMLVDQGKLAWNDPVNKHLPSFRMYDPWVTSQIEVEDLFCHRSGLPAEALLSMYFQGYPMPLRVRGLAFVQPITSFRSTFAYQNCNYDAAGQLIEAKTGQSWEDQLKANIFAKLGMTRTTARQAEVDTMSNVASGHLILADGNLWTIPRDWPNRFISDATGAAGAVRSTVTDMAQWLRLTIGLGTVGTILPSGLWGTQRLVSEANMRYLQAPKILMNDWTHGVDSPYWGPQMYASGWMYLALSPQPLIWHSGGMAGMCCAIGFVPGANTGIVILTNVGDSSSSDPVVTAKNDLSIKILFRFYDLCFGRTTSLAALAQDLPLLSPEKLAELPPSRPDQAPALPPERYCGVYFNPAYGAYTVTRSGNSLVMIMGPRHLRADLISKGDHDFEANLPDWPATCLLPVRIPITFTVPATGAASSFVAADMKDVNQGVFNRIAAIPYLGLLLLGSD